MSQTEILNFLKTQTEWVDVNEITKHTSSHRQNVCKQMSTLYRIGDVRRKQVRTYNTYKYLYKYNEC